MKTILYDPALVAARDSYFSRLSSIFAGETPDQPFYLNGINGTAEVDPYMEPEAWVDSALKSLEDRARLLLDEAVFRPLCLEFGPYGVHFVDRIFDARVYEHAGQWWSDPLSTQVGTLVAPDIERDDTWRLARRIAEAFLAHNTTVPLFGLPTIASALNVAVNLYGERFLIALLDRPEDARRDLQTINNLLGRLHTWYIEKIPAMQLQCVVAAQRAQSPQFGQICGCTNHLLSAAMYENAVAALDDALLSVYPNGGMMHLCGRHLQHLSVWRRMNSLRAVQLNDRAADDFEAYFSGLREDQVIYLNPTPAMSAECAISITGGKRLVIAAMPGGGDPKR